MSWNPFGVLLEISASAVTVTRTSATQFTVKIAASWETYYSGAQTNYGMTASSGGASVTLNPFGTKSSGGSGNLTGTYSISGNAAATKTVAVTFRNFNNDNGNSATKTLNVSVTVPAWTSYTVKYNANGGSGAPSSQTKWKDQALTLSSAKPTRAGYSFQGWATSAGGGVAYASGAKYTANAAVTLYAVWKANTYTVSYNANGGSGAPASQTKTYGVALTLSSTKPTRTNYTFKGWTTSPTSSSVVYAAGASYTANAAISLFAVWELAYSKPRITNASAKRCDESGTPTENGTYALVSFSWASDVEDPGLYMEAGSAAHDDTLSGTSGDYSVYFGDGSFNTESSYQILIAVDDGIEGNHLYITLNSLRYTVHGKPGGDGIAFGKTSELGAADSLGGRGVAEFAFDGKFNAPVYGKALGMDRVPAIPANADVNEYLDPGCFAIYSNAVAATIANLPVDGAGRFEVWSATGEGVRAEQWSYLRQRFIPYNMGNAVWERELTRGEDNVWHYYDWWQSSLTPAVAARIYSKAAITVSLSANITLGITQTYTQIPFNNTAVKTSDRLILQSGAVRIGANISYIKASGQLLIKSGSDTGNRHARIQKVSGSTTTSHSWTCLPTTASSNVLYTLTPAIIPVKEGDLIKIVYYTWDSADQHTSGSSANGWQSYLTVEEI